MILRCYLNGGINRRLIEGKLIKTNKRTLLIEIPRLVREAGHFIQHGTKIIKRKIERDIPK